MKFNHDLKTFVQPSRELKFLELQQIVFEGLDLRNCYAHYLMW